MLTFQKVKATNSQVRHFTCKTFEIDQHCSRSLQGKEKGCCSELMDQPESDGACLHYDSLHLPYSGDLSPATPLNATLPMPNLRKLHFPHTRMSHTNLCTVPTLRMFPRPVDITSGSPSGQLRSPRGTPRLLGTNFTAARQLQRRLPRTLKHLAFLTSPVKLHQNTH